MHLNAGAFYIFSTQFSIISHKKNTIKYIKFIISISKEENLNA